MEFEDISKFVKEYIKENNGTTISTIFRETLYYYMHLKGIPKQSEVYKKARIDRRLFSKCISKGRKYNISKNIVISLGLALELNMDELAKLLASAGFSFNFEAIFDLIIKYCIEHNMYNIEIINLLLAEAGEKPLHKE
jgi:hypothetical protein